MSVKTKCQTPGATISTHINDTLALVSVDVVFPPDRCPLCLSKKEAKLLQANLHNAVEMVLARYF